MKSSLIHKQLNRLAGFTTATLVMLVLSVPLTTGIAFAAAPALISNTAIACTSGTSCATASFTCSQNNLLVVAEYVPNGSLGVPTVSDTLSNSFTRAVDFNSSNDFSIWYAVCTKYGTDMLIGTGGFSTTVVLEADQFTGLGASVQVDAANHGTGSGSASSGTAAGTVANELYFGAGNAPNSGGVTLSGSGNFGVNQNQLTSGSNASVRIGFNAASAVDTESINVGGTGNVGAAIVAFSPAASSSGGTSSGTVTTLGDQGFTAGDVQRFALFIVLCIAAWTIRQFKFRGKA